MNELMKGCPWAANRVKLEQSIKALIAKKAVDSKIEVTEESVREEYVKRAGLIVEKGMSDPHADEANENADAPAPRRRSK